MEKLGVQVMLEGNLQATMLMYHTNEENYKRPLTIGTTDKHGCEELLHTFTTNICTHNKNPVGNGTIM
jgi:hypothetical protein